MPRWATSAACPAFEAISVIDALICSAPAAIDWTPELTCSEASEAELARSAASAAPDCSWALTADSSSEALASVTADPPMVVTVSRRVARAMSRAWPICPGSSRDRRPVLWVRSP